MAVKICLTGEPELVEAITRGECREWPVVYERDVASRRNPAHVRRYVTIATERGREQERTQ